MDTNNNPRIYTVTELNHLIRKGLESSFSDIWLEGEVSNFFFHNSKHMYFDLKDENSKVRVVMFHQDNCRLVFDIEEGLHIQVNGYVSVYEKRGEYQVIALDARPVGKGALILAFEQLKEKLFKKGFFDSERKRKIPMLPQKIGVATSIGGAVLKDILSVLIKRFPNFHLIVRNVNVGGINSAPELCGAIEDLCEYGVDVIIIARGGGSLEDLWGFNSEELAYSIYNSRVPVISAVGHQTDFTISDFVADLRAATPSVAAENVILDKEKMTADINSMVRSMQDRLLWRVRNYRKQLRTLISRKYFKMPVTILGTKYQDTGSGYRELVDGASDIIKQKKGLINLKASRLTPDRIIALIGSYRLTLRNNGLLQVRNIKNNVKNKKQYTAFILESLEKNNPINIIRRGFAIIYDSSRKNIKSIMQASAGDNIYIQMRDGSIRAKVMEMMKKRLLRSGKEYEDR